jgi:hypothetical protein
VIGYLKGKSAIAIARQFAGRDRHFAGSILGPAGMRSRRWALSWNKCGPLFGSRKTPTELGVFRPFTVTDRL